MKQYRRQIEDLVSLLAYIVKDFDDDGLDIYFTQTPYKRNSKKSREISSLIYPQLYSGIPDMRVKLQNILEEPVISPSRSICGRQRPLRTQKPLSIYIMTDAKWQPKNDVGGVIIDIVEKLRANNLPKEYVGIQFIRFGDDQASIQKLDKLHHGLGLNAEKM